MRGNWGFVDRPEPVLDGRLSDKLEGAYRSLLDLHLTHGIPATFAFVGFYALTPAARADYLAAQAETLRNRIKFLARECSC